MKLRIIGMNLCAAVALGSAVPVSAFGGFPANNVEMLSQVTLGQFQANFAEDCWGYVSESGREYAIVGLSTGTAFVEITDPENPVIIDIIERPTRGRDMKVYQHYVYSSSDQGPFDIIDVGDIDNGVVTLLDRLEGATHNIFINEESGFMYLSIGGPMIVIDLADPEVPEIAGIWDSQAHDVQVVNYHGGPYDGREIAFVFAGWDGNVDIVDVTDKENMTLLSRTTYRDPGYTHQGWLTADRQHLFVSDELDEINGEPETRTIVFDVSDLENPVVVNEFTTGRTSTDHNLYIRDGFLFEANYSSGMHVFDVRDPLNVVYTGFFDTNPDNDNVGFQGAWTAYPFFPSGTVIVSESNGGLFVLDASDATQRSCVREPAWQCDGDVDGDGQVNPVDSGLVQAAFGSGDDQDVCNYDLDCDGQINPVDSGIVQSLFGTCEPVREVCP